MINMSNFAPQGALLHSAEGHEHGLMSRLFEGLGGFGRFADEVLWHGLVDTLKLLPFLFLTYLLMEYIEHRASERTQAMLSRAGTAGPLLGGALGAVPQCGFSAVAANLYTAKVLSAGTLIAVFLSTSDEMLPILIAGNISPVRTLYIVLYKVAVGVLVGFALDFGMHLAGKKRPKIDIDAICEEDNCHCERGILHSAIHHTLTVSLFVLAVTLGINAVVFFVDADVLGRVMSGAPFLSYLISALIGLVPNCASSVLLTRLCTAGVISTGAMIAGLLPGAGVGILVLFRMNKNVKANLTLTVLLVAVGIIFGAIADLLPFLAIA